MEAVTKWMSTLHTYMHLHTITYPMHPMHAEDLIACGSGDKWMFLVDDMMDLDESDDDAGEDMEVCVCVCA